MNTFFFAVYPYICLVIFTLGLGIRYIGTPGEWNARSSNLYAKRSLAVGSYIFHYSIILAFFGHIIGLLIPETILSAFGLSYQFHTMLASFFGKILALGVFIGAGILLVRRCLVREVWDTTYCMDIVVLCFIIFQSITGGCQDFIGGFDVFDTVAPWVRGVLCCDPRPELMLTAPAYLKIHAVCGFTIVAMIPFSRLVHFISAPIFWFARPAISYRKRYENL